MAAPNKFTPEAKKKILDALRVGNTRRASAGAAGISKSLFYEWIQKGEKAKSGEFLDFLDAVTRAEAECEVQNVAILKKAASGWDTKATRTKTKSYQEIYLKDDGTPVLGEDGKPLRKIVTETETVTTEGREFDWRASLEWLKRRKRADWGDSLDIRTLDDETLLRLLAKGHEEDTP